MTNIDEDVVKLANDLITDFFLSDISLDLVVNCYKIIIEIIKIMGDDELRAKQTAEPYMKLLGKDICSDIDIKDSNIRKDDTCLVIKIKNPNIINDNRIEDALSYLGKYKTDYHQICNSKGEKVKGKAFQGFIFEIYKAESYIKFLISYYQLNKLLKLAEHGYNNLLATIINNICGSTTYQTKESELLTTKYLNETFGINKEVAKDMCKKLFGSSIMCLLVCPKTEKQINILTSLFKEMNIDFKYTPLPKEENYIPLLVLR